jgi:hypothetical protein
VAGNTSTLTWNLVANSAGYVAGMNKAHTSTAKFQKELQKAERSQRNLTRTIVSAAAAAAVVRFGVQSVKAYAEAEKAQAKLAEAYRKFPRLADTNITALRALNSELQRKTRFDDDATAAAQATLAQYDLTGKQIAELTPLLQDMASVMGTDVTDAAGSLGRAFLGNARALKAVGIDFKATGDRAKDFDTIMGALTTKVGGFAESEGKTAAGQLAIMNNAVGDLQESVGEALVPALTQMVDVITPAVRYFTELPTPVRTTAIAVTALGGAALLAAPRVLALQAALAANGKSLPSVGKGLKVAAAGIAAVLAVKGLTSLGDQSVNAGKGIDTLRDALADTSKPLDGLGFSLQGITKGTYDFNEAVKVVADPGVINSLEGGLASVFGGLPSKLGQSEDAVNGIQAALVSLVQDGNLSAAKMRFEELRASFTGAGGTGDEFDRVFADAKAAISGTVPPTVELTDKTQDLADVWHDAEGNLKSFGQALADLNTPAKDVTQSQIAVINSSKELAKGMREQSTSFALSSEAGRANRTRLMELTGAIAEYGAAVEKKTGSTDKARAAVLRERDALVKNLEKTGLARDKAERLVDQYLKIPGAAKAARSEVELLSAALSRMPSKVTVLSARSKARANGLASGGMVRGPGSGTSDSVPAMLSNGEFVMRASAVQRHGAGFFHALNFADGGLVDTGFGERGKAKAKAKAKSRTRSTSKASAGRDWSVRDALRGDAALDFDFTAYGSAVEAAAAATRDLADADRAVFDARRKINQAGTPAERADAERELADAYAAQAAAGKELAAAEKAKAAAKPTGRNILAGFRARAGKLDRFRRDLKTLKSWGLSGVILRQLVDAGIDDGGDMAAALVKDRSVIADLNKTQAAINKDALAINGPGSSGSTGGGGSTGSGGTTGSAGTVTIGFADASRPVVLQMDSEKVWKGLLRLKKDKGNAKLHLD